MKSEIAAVSYYLPGKILTNEELADLNKNTSAGELFKRTGVKERRILDRSILPSDFALASFRNFLQQHPKIDPNEIDFLIHCSEGTDYRSPCTAAVIQHKCGLTKSTGAFDLSLSCSGYVYGLLLASSLIESKQAHNVLFIAQGVPSWVVHEEETEMRALFGDASSCTLIRSASHERIGNFVTGTDGAGEHALYVDRSSGNHPLDEKWFGEENNFCFLPYGRMKMNGVDIFSFSLSVVPGLVAGTLEKNGLTENDIDLFIFHQANAFMLETLRKKMKIPVERFVISMEKTGNTVSASIPVCLSQCILSGRAQKGNKILIAGFGAGFSWAATVITL